MCYARPGSWGAKISDCFGSDQTHPESITTLYHPWFSMMASEFFIRTQLRTFYFRLLSRGGFLGVTFDCLTWRPYVAEINRKAFNAYFPLRKKNYSGSKHFTSDTGLRGKLKWLPFHWRRDVHVLFLLCSFAP